MKSKGKQKLREWWICECGVYGRSYESHHFVWANLGTKRIRCSATKTIVREVPKKERKRK